MDKINLIISKELETKIRILCSKFISTEWSGVLFYKPSGSIEDGTAELLCVDLLLMDIGNATFTSFECDSDIAKYMTEDLSLLDCTTGLIHSHHNMGTFFSGTDMDTLNTEGSERPYFLSLIVNNAGVYNAKLTRKSEITSEITSLQDCVDFAGNSTYIETKKIETKSIVETFDTVVKFEIEKEDYYKYISDRIDFINNKKKTITPAYNTNYKNLNLSSTYKSNPTELPFKSNSVQYNHKNEEQDEMLVNANFPFSAKETAQFTINEPALNECIMQLLSGSLIVVSKDVNKFDDLVLNLDRRMNNRFKNDAESEYYISCIMSMVIDEYPKKVINTNNKQGIDNLFIEMLVEELTNINIGKNSKTVNTMIDEANAYLQ